MKFSIIFLFFLFFTSASIAGDYLQLNCALVEINSGKALKQFGAKDCHFFNNGSRLELNDTFILKLDAQGDILWKYDSLYHHQFFVDEANDELYFLDASKHTVAGCVTRFDSITVLDLKTGKYRRTIDFFDFDKDLHPKINHTVLFKANFQHILGSFTCQTTHINSFYQIEKDVDKNIFKKGNWIVNVVRRNIIAVFNQDFTKLIWKKEYPAQLELTHDVKLIPSGELAMYVNSYREKASDESRSALVIMDQYSQEKLLLPKQVIYLKIKSGPFVQYATGGFAFQGADTFYYSSFENNKYMLHKMNVDGTLLDFELKYSQRMRPLWFQQPKIINLLELPK